jgi:hypothetical protein
MTETPHDPLDDMRAKRLTTCAHFSGLLDKRCRAGVAYAQVRSRAGGHLAIACFGDVACRPVCAHYRPPTAEELEQKDRESRRICDLHDRGLSACCEAPLDESLVIRDGPYEGHGPRHCTACRKIAFTV